MLIWASFTTTSIGIEQWFFVQCYLPLRAMQCRWLYGPLWIKNGQWKFLSWVSHTNRTSNEFHLTIDTYWFEFTLLPGRWRLYVVCCALPGLMSFIVLCFLPESPKFVLSQGKQAEAYQILQTMNRINNGKNAKLDEFEILEEKESIENRERILQLKKGKYPLLSSIWNQTAPLFRPPHLKPALLLCFIQVWVYYTCYGFYMLYADVLNRMVTNVKVCNVLYIYNVYQPHALVLLKLI